MNKFLFAVLLLLQPGFSFAAFDHSHARWDALTNKHVVWLPGGHASQVDYGGFTTGRATASTPRKANSKCRRFSTGTARTSPRGRDRSKPGWRSTRTSSPTTPSTSRRFATGKPNSNSWITTGH